MEKLFGDKKIYTFNKKNRNQIIKEITKIMNKLTYLKF